MISFKTLPRYESLDINLPIIETNCLNVIVDLKSFLHQYFSNNYRFVGEMNLDVTEILTKMISIISHYRNYFFKTKGIQTKFFVLYSKEKCQKILSLYPDYKKKLYHRYDDANDYNKQCINKAVELLEPIVNYIEGCIFVETSDFDENCYIRYIVESTAEVCVVLTKFPEMILPVLNQTSFALETYTDRILYHLYDRESIVKSLLLGNDYYGFKSSHVSEEKYNESWKNYILENQLIKQDTTHNPLDYDKMLTLIKKNKPSIAASIYRHRTNQDLIFNILYGSAFYFINKKILEAKLLNTHPKYNYGELCDLNDLFGCNPVNIRGLMRGYI